MLKETFELKKSRNERGCGKNHPIIKRRWAMHVNEDIINTIKIFCHTYSSMPIIVFNINGISSSARLYFIRKEMDKVKGQV